ncbi:hypothetical protein BDQ12DRAFT_203673 [Crucibulum laeve]|uniref:Protein CPL1-like domain-containing protein n=1 Tax=Crucibulum laeve TaxID=68775 RepID=A0A5C3MHZ7_9AGAR|nr:hypothetical protein BDQ12DRAFT_203673 [Crucibulum laeve]
MARLILLVALFAFLGAVAARCPVGFALIPADDSVSKCICRSGTKIKKPDPSCAYTVSGRVCLSTCPKNRRPNRKGPKQVVMSDKGSREHCPEESEPCPINPTDVNSEMECIAPLEDIANCGGCVSLGKGQDCASVPGARVSECVRGVCKMRSCSRGYRLDAVAGTCISKPRIVDLLKEPSMH